ncbi:MAG TPA: hypothetical protein VFK41_13150 [Nocardioidaceae bacterium]|nr:hypothetical protein [Nocardioidaceae bacterium]
MQAIYAVASDRPDRYAEVADLIRGYAGWVDQIFADSAAKTGGYRHVRWVTPNCNLDVAHVLLSASGDDSFSNTRNELAANGFSRSDRKYLVWVDATTYCGIADVHNDDQPSAQNRNNSGADYARVDTGCWGAAYSTEAHELMHLLGGVQLSAPHTTGAWHCTDQNDRMCYMDGGSTSSPQTYPCEVDSLTLFDCGNDDYFHTNPAPGSYLATHWNAAANVFLASDPSGSPTSQPVTETFTGSLSKRTPSRSFGVNVHGGTMTTRLSFTKASALRLTLRSADGSIVATSQGTSVLSQSVAVSDGYYNLTVSLPAGSGATFSASVEHL